jgi:8-oxo-dGTP diphosphatase
MQGGQNDHVNWREDMSVGHGDVNRVASDVPASDPRIGRILLAAAILVHEDRVLLVRRSITERFLPGVWGVPCGKVEPGEKPDEAAIRELREETGLDGSVVRYVGETAFHSVWRGRRTLNEQSNFLMQPAGAPGQVKLPSPDQEASWVPADIVEDFSGLDAYNRTVIRQWTQTVFR